MQNKIGVGQNVVSLPQGGGAIKGIGESLQVHEQKGTLSFTLPIEIPSGRENLQPELAITYSSGSGNGPFGLGWSLNIPYISRKTSRGIPRYLDSDVDRSQHDTFLLSGVQSLLLINDENSDKWFYQPEFEGLFAKIERRFENDKDFWVIRSKNGMTYYYEEGVYDVRRPSNIFQWFLSKVEDTFGNTILYSYAYFDDVEQKYERNHTHQQKYLTKISYMNYGEQQFLYNIEFEYEYRPDPFSNYKPGFELRTTRRCKAIKIKLLGEENSVYKTYFISYEDEVSNAPPMTISLIRQVQVIGEYNIESEKFPPLIFSYTQFDLTKRQFEDVKFQLNQQPEDAITGNNFTLVDIFGNGLPCILHTQRNRYRYWRNQGGTFDMPQFLESSPPHILSDHGVAFADVLGNGSADLLVATGEHAGYYELQFDGKWNNWRSYAKAPAFNIEDPNTRFIDVTGDGLMDVCVTVENALLFYLNRGKDGWSSPIVMNRLHDLEEFPDIFFSDYHSSVRLADMTGDGMLDIVLLQRNLLCFWPNLGYGRFGKRITLLADVALPPEYDSQRLFLADINGDGCADLIYVNQSSVSIWQNNQGNSLSFLGEIQGTPVISDHTIQIVDLKGHGVSGILWSYSSNIYQGSRCKFLDLTGGVKPYLLNTIDNSIGAIKKITYRPSTFYYLRDQHQGKSWLTSLPFPVHCVARVEIYDYFSRSKLTQEYLYHHGYWDGVEREFCGFGRVDVRDTEQFDDYHCVNHEDSFNIRAVKRSAFSPPVETRHWYHLGAFMNRDTFPDELNYRNEYWAYDQYDYYPLPAENLHILDENFERQRRALNSLRGSLLRKELYALDGTSFEDRPYLINNIFLNVNCVNHSKYQGIPIYFVRLRMEKNANWERSDEPVIRFTIYDDYDEYGQAQQILNIAVPKQRCVDYHLDKPVNSEPYLMTLSQKSFAEMRNGSSKYIHDRISTISEYEIINQGTETLQQLVNVVQESRYSADIRKKIQSRIYYYYDGKAYEGGLELEQYAALVRVEKLCFTEEQVQSLLERLEITDFNTLGYSVKDEADIGKSYFSITERRKYDFHDEENSIYGLMLERLDELKNAVKFTYDDYFFHPKTVVISSQLTITYQYDYRFGKPRSVIDCNQNQTRYQFTPLGNLKCVIQPDDTFELPSISYNYFFTRFIENRLQPIGIHIKQRVSTDRSAELLEKWQYTDGFGRLLQTRIKVDNENLGDPLLGALPFPDGDPIPESIFRLQTIENRVVVDGWQHYDNKGRVIMKYASYFSSDLAYQELDATTLSQLPCTTTFYDPLGRVIKTVLPNGSQYQTIYGNIPNLEFPEQWLPSPWEYHLYDPNDLNLNDNLNQFTSDTVKIDALGRIIESVKIKKIDSSQPPESLTQQTLYDLRGNVLKIVINDREQWRYEHDFLGRAFNIWNLDSGTTSFLFNAAGLVVYKKDNKGNLIKKEYDECQRIKAIYEIVSQSRIQKVAYQYGDDEPNNNLKGNLFRLDDESGTVFYEQYDARNNLLAYRRQFLQDQILADFDQDGAFSVDWNNRSVMLDTTTYRFSFKYNSLDQLIQISFPSTSADQTSFIQYSYNKNGQLMKIVFRDKTIIEKITYNPKSLRTAIQYGLNGEKLKTYYQYDPKTSWLTRIHSKNDNGQILQHSNYSYDLIGNPLEIRHVDYLSSFRYDSIYQLIFATGRMNRDLHSLWTDSAERPMIDTKNYQQAFSHDIFGNLTGLEHLVAQSASGPFTPAFERIYKHSTNNNQLTHLEVDTQGYDYLFDANGSLEEEKKDQDTRQFVWNSANQLTFFKQNGQARLYNFYGPDGIRTKKYLKKEDGTKESVVYNGNFFEHRRRYDSNNAVVSEQMVFHIMDRNERTASIHLSLQNHNIFFYLSDHLHSSIVQTDQDGRLLSKEEFTPFGETCYVEGSVNEKYYRFNSKERDEGSSLYYYGARYYLPSIARWLTPDPMGFIGESSPYLFSRNNPMFFFDTNGKQSGPNQNDMRKATQSEKEIFEIISQEKARQVHLQEGGFMDNIFSTPRGKSFVGEVKRMFTLTEKNLERVVKNATGQVNRYAGKLTTEVKDLVGEAIQIGKNVIIVVPDNKVKEMRALLNAMKGKIDDSVRIVIVGAERISSIAKHVSESREVRERLAKIVPGVGTGLGAAFALNEAAQGHYANALVEGAGASEIPMVAQAADLGSLAAAIGWVVKDQIDPEQKLEQLYYETFLK